MEREAVATADAKGEDVGVGVSGESHRVGDRVQNERACGDTTSMLESSVSQNEACGSKKARWDLRKRKKIRLRPFAIE